jgi:hypothetical protein
LANAFFDECADFDCRTDLLRVWPRVNDSTSQLFRAIVEKLVQRSFGPPISSAANHESRVDDDASEPSGIRGPPFESLQLCECSAQAILHGVLGIFAVAQYAECHATELAGVGGE